MARRARPTEPSASVGDHEEPPPAWWQRAVRRYKNGCYPSTAAVPLDQAEAERRAERDWQRLSPDRRAKAWHDDDALAEWLARTRDDGPLRPLAVPPSDEK